jgi:hypothetical protein
MEPSEKPITSHFLGCRSLPSLTASLTAAKPKPRSKKGAGGEKVFGPDLFAGTLAEYAPLPSDGIAAFYLMVDPKGACELTRPIVKGGTFTSYVERIYLSSGIELDGESLLAPESDPIANFDPEVVRKP